MRKGSRALLVAAVCAIALVAVGQAAAAKSHLRLNYYSATTTQAKYQKLLTKGADIAAVRNVKGGKVRVFAVLTPRQVKAYAKRGLKFKVVRNKFGQTARSAAAAQKSTGYDVWMDYDGPDGYAAFLRKVAAENPQLAKLVVIGHSGQGREILAIKLTQGARGQADGSRPAVLYSAMQHAREWIAGEVDRRLMMWYIDKWRANNTAGQEPPEGHGALVRPGREPGRLPVHVPEPGDAALAQDAPGQQRKRDGRGRRRRRSEPQLLGALELRQRGLVGRPVERHVPRPGRRVGARDARDGGPAPVDPAEVPGELPLVRQVAPLPGGLADRHADVRRPDLLRALRQPGQPGHPGLQPGPLVRRPLRDERRDDRLRAPPDEDARVDAGALRRRLGPRLRVPGRRGARAGRVREHACVRPERGQVGARPGEPQVLARAHDEAVLPPERRHLQGGPPARELQVRRLVRRSADGSRRREALARRRHAQVAGRTAARSTAPRRPSGTAGRSTAGRPTSTTAR